MGGNSGPGGCEDLVVKEVGSAVPLPLLIFFFLIGFPNSSILIFFVSTIGLPDWSYFMLSFVVDFFDFVFLTLTGTAGKGLGGTAPIGVDEE